MTVASVALVGCGRLGSAILEGWLTTGAVAPDRLIILTPSDKPAADQARGQGALVNPPLDQLAKADVVLLAVKPGVWRAVLDPLVGSIRPGAAIVSVMAGVSAEDIATVSGRRVCRVMPTTAVAQARGVAAIWSADSDARAVGYALFAPLADVVDLDDEAHMDAATAVAGSGPGFILAFVQAMAAAGTQEGLSSEAATQLARGALRSAASGLDSGQPLDDLIARIASPGGTTRAGLDAMAVGEGVTRLAQAAVTAAVARAKTL